MRLLVTGGAGFIGSNFIHYVLEHTADWTITNLDALTYAGNLENLSRLESDPRYRFVRGDVADPAAVEAAIAGGIDAIVNFAAESHVDRSIEDAAPFVRTNVEGTLVLLQAARRAGVGRLLQVSTDEVYGSLGPEGRFTEDSPLGPNSPYAASKTAADLMCRAFHHTYGLDVVITRCGNNHGPYQFPEKFIPLCIIGALQREPIPLYGDGSNVRDWIFVEDHCAALLAVLERGRPGRVYNVGAGGERANRDVAAAICDLVGAPRSLITRVADRPGHDHRYAVDAARVRSELGWRPRLDFETGLEATVAWYTENRSWWERVRSGEYRAYYDRMYGERLRRSLPGGGRT